MNTFDEYIAILKNATGAKTIKELAKILDINYRTLTTWQTRGEIPAKKKIEIFTKLGIRMDKMIGAVAIGSQNIAINGDNNALNHQNDITNTPKFKEFLELFTKYGNDATLDYFIKKLKALKEILEN
ncbi:hypothetical protein LMG7974_01637 [Campylobacter majalis]|uniref:Bacteriophage CI repressor N-terminal domain-containing protein n=1 Tax=Campylobacter majalis TaxID=2790656 RepID=A0ABN7KBJ7_9BACT|nr:helix-turn-helix domain-containing protein [Campylobacter majalis]CAD7289560.1 hypothetical protein LMG7974_01637 [Campylobacter majalis]